MLGYARTEVETHALGNLTIMHFNLKRLFWITRGKQPQDIRRKKQAESVRKRNEGKYDPSGIRDRLLARKAKLG